MRLKITLHHRANVLIPLNYQYEVSAWIYKVISQANSEFAIWLHNKGYDNGERQYKFFNFSRLESQPFVVLQERGGMLLEGTRTILNISFLVEDAIKYFVMGIFQNQHFGLGNADFHPVDFEVAGVELLPPPSISTTMDFRTNSAICLSTQTLHDRYAQYLHPEDDQYALLFEKNLQSRLVTAITHGVMKTDNNIQSIPHPPFAMELRSAPKKKKIVIKANTNGATDIIGYEYEFRLTAAASLMNIGLEAGFGEKGSMGFGYCGWRSVVEEKMLGHAPR